MKKILFIPLLFLCSLSYAAPTTTAIDGYNIDGINFGEGSTVIAFDTFDDKEVGIDLTTSSVIIGGLDWKPALSPSRTGVVDNIVSNENSYSGNNSYLQRYNDIYEDSGNGAKEWRDDMRLRFPALWTAFFSSKYYITHTGDHFRQLKFFRFSKYGTYNDSPRITFTTQDLYAWTFSYNEYDNSTNVSDTITGRISENTWHSYEFITDLSESVANTTMYFDDEIVAQDTDEVANLTEGIGEVSIAEVMQLNSGTGGTYKIFFDDIFLATNQARVVVCDSSIYSNRTILKTFIQGHTAWSDTEITVTYNQGSFINGETAYLFVIDKDGNISDGLEGYFIDNIFYKKIYSAKFGQTTGTKSISLGNKVGNKTITIR